MLAMHADLALDNKKSLLIYVTLPDLEPPLERSGYGPGVGILSVLKFVTHAMK